MYLHLLSVFTNRLLFPKNSFNHVFISKKLVSPVSCFQCGYVADLRRYQLLKKVSRQVQNYMEPKAVVGPALKVVFSFVVSKIQWGLHLLLAGQSNSAVLCLRHSK